MDGIFIYFTVHFYQRDAPNKVSLNTQNKHELFQLNGLHPVVSNDHSHRYKLFHLTHHFIFIFKRQIFRSKLSSSGVLLQNLTNQGKMLFERSLCENNIIIFVNVTFRYMVVYFIVEERLRMVVFDWNT
jgi:hypothetical protein